MSELTVPEEQTDNFFTSFVSDIDLSNILLKKSLLSCLKSLIKTLNPSSKPIISFEFSTASPLTFLENCYRLSENLKNLISLGHKKKNFPMLVPESEGKQEIDISVISKLSSKDVLGLLLKCDSSGVYLSGKESRALFSLVVGSLRDSAVHTIYNSCKLLQKKTYKKQKKLKKLEKNSKKNKTLLFSLKKATLALNSEISTFQSQLYTYKAQLAQVKSTYARQQAKNLSLHSELCHYRSLLHSSLTCPSQQINLHLRPSLLPEDRLTL